MDLETPSRPLAQLGFESSLHLGRLDNPQNRRARHADCTSPPAQRLQSSLISYCGRMALSATVYHFEIALSDSDRGVYESLSFRVAQHPSETGEYLATRVLAYCLEYTRGLNFSKGLSEPDVPALTVHDLTGVLTSWIEVGLPEPARLHKAAKACPRVVVYAHRDVSAWLPRLAGESIHRAGAIEIYAVDLPLIAAFAAQLTRRMKFDCVASDRHLYLSFGENTLSGSVTRHQIDE
jgi:uncharacterized protein YaeQ